MDKALKDEILTYIETPRVSHVPEKIDAILARRMREFMLARRQRKWIMTGE